MSQYSIFCLPVEFCIEFPIAFSGKFPRHASGVYHSIPARGLQMGVPRMESVTRASNLVINPAARFLCNDYIEHILIHVHFRCSCHTLYIRRPSPLSCRSTNKTYIADRFHHKCHRFLH